MATVRFGEGTDLSLLITQRRPALVVTVGFLPIPLTDDMRQHPLVIHEAFLLGAVAWSGLKYTQQRDGKCGRHVVIRFPRPHRKGDDEEQCDDGEYGGLEHPRHGCREYDAAWSEVVEPPRFPFRFPSRLLLSLARIAAKQTVMILRLGI